MRLANRKQLANSAPHQVALLFFYSIVLQKPNNPKHIFLPRYKQRSPA